MRKDNMGKLMIAVGVILLILAIATILPKLACPRCKRKIWSLEVHRREVNE